MPQNEPPPPTPPTPPAPRWAARPLLIALVLSCVLPGVLGAAALFRRELDEGRERRRQDTLQTARALVQVVDHTLWRALTLGQALAQSALLQQGDLRAFHAQARQSLRTSAAGTQLLVADPQGRTLLSTAVAWGQATDEAADAGMVRAVLASGGESIADLQSGARQPAPAVHVQVPVYAAGQAAYVLVVKLPAAQFNEVLSAQALPAGWRAGVVDSTGTIVGRNIHADRYVGIRPPQELLRAMQSTREGSLETDTLEGARMLVSYSRSAVTGWGVAIGMPPQAVLPGLLGTLSTAAAGVAALFALALLLGRVVGGRIARSMEALTAPAQALGQGVQVPIPAMAIREAHEVAVAISRAAALLAEREATLRERDAELAEVLRLARFGTWQWNLDTGQLRTSSSLRDVFGTDPPPFEQQRGTLLPPDEWDRLAAAVRESMRTGQGYDLELRARHASGAALWIHAQSQALRDAQGRVVALRGTVHDITERRRAEQRAREAALHDPLTGLPNRALVFEYCGHLLAAARRGHARGALLFIDLDRFKPINDAHGHEVGDRVLQEVGRRLATCTRHEDLVGRLGGDEFVVILPHLEDELPRAEVVARHVIASIGQPVRVGDIALTVLASVGIAHFPEHATEPGALIHAADTAMYRAKQAGAGRWEVYAPAQPAAGAG